MEKKKVEVKKIISNGKTYLIYENHRIGGGAFSDICVGRSYENDKVQNFIS